MPPPRTATWSGRPARSDGSGSFADFEHRRQHVDELHLLSHAAALPLVAGELHDERHAVELVEEAAAVEPEAMVEELLAVVGEEDDERVVVQPVLLELTDEAAELTVAERDVAVVLRDHPLAVERLLVVGARVLRGVALRRVRLEHPIERLGRRVRYVGVHRVHVEERR